MRSWAAAAQSRFCFRLSTVGWTGTPEGLEHTTNSSAHSTMVSFSGKACCLGWRWTRRWDPGGTGAAQLVARRCSRYTAPLSIKLAAAASSSPKRSCNVSLRGRSTHRCLVSA